jgi:hypothetical protein
MLTTLQLGVVEYVGRYCVCCPPSHAIMTPRLCVAEALRLIARPEIIRRP